MFSTLRRSARATLFEYGMMVGAATDYWMRRSLCLRLLDWLCRGTFGEEERSNYPVQISSTLRCALAWLRDCLVHINQTLLGEHMSMLLTTDYDTRDHPHTHIYTRTHKHTNTHTRFARGCNGWRFCFDACLSPCVLACERFLDGATGGLQQLVVRFFRHHAT